MPLRPMSAKKAAQLAKDGPAPRAPLAKKSKKRLAAEAAGLVDNARKQIARVGKKGRANRKSMKSVRAEVFERDNNRCRKCGLMAHDPHHLFPTSHYSHLRLEPRNVVALCREHHDIADANKAAYRDWARGLGIGFEDIHDEPSDEPKAAFTGKAGRWQNRG